MQSMRFLSVNLEHINTIIIIILEYLISVWNVSDFFFVIVYFNKIFYIKRLGEFDDRQNRKLFTVEKFDSGKFT